MSNYSLQNNKFVIENYTTRSAFSSFLPGIAGVTGTPIWAFYCNRGQGINSFGINHKGDAMMEFNSANTAYENTPLKGFRTFMEVNGKYVEPFCVYDNEVERVMEIENNVLTIHETGHGLKFSVSYIILPNENIGALVRNVKIKNLSGEKMTVKLFDGMAQIIPYGTGLGLYKEMSNLFKSWADVKNIEEGAPVFAMRSSSDDSAEVSEIVGGFFYTAIKDGENLHIVYDKKRIFGENDSMTVASGLLEKGFMETAKAEQCFANKVPCAFAFDEVTLEAGAESEFTAFAGFAPSLELLNTKVGEFKQTGYTEKKFEEARVLVGNFTKDCATDTANPLFDKYVEQCYMDNFLRGGYPFVFGEGKDRAVVHLFSRKHGDPERDYNWFSTAGEFYSQGNGNYRDVCQNRRHDVFFNPAIGDFNVYQFYSMVQIDGYNPLEIRPSTFVINQSEMGEAKAILSECLPAGTDILEKIISAPFTPGAITNAIAKNELTVKIPQTELVEKLIALSEEQLEAGFGEGYWCDHWDYNLDLLEDYLRIFPDKAEETLFEENKYRFYSSPVTVRPIADVAQLNKGKVRAYGAVCECEERKAQEGFNAGGTNWLKNADGTEVKTTLFGKLLTLATAKLNLLDPEQMGIEMEGGKPGWNDAMNGLPGLFGSGMPETVELKRTVDKILEFAKGREGSVILPAEIGEQMLRVGEMLAGNKEGFEYWSEQVELREAYRAKTKVTLSGETKEVTFEEIRKVFTAGRNRLEKGVAKALKIGKGIMPTYFTYDATDYEVQKNEDGTDRKAPYGLPAVKILGFKRNDLPRFLEGPARLLAASDKKDLERNREMFAEIKKSDIYDKPLKMYKTSESIEEMTIENGRVRAFTPGWLERESIFLHMEYKYFLGLIKAGMYEEFYEAVDDALVPYQDPAVYKRSILENSSFIASSANPDKSVHGQGFVARLTGSTVEMLSMWIRMFLGEGGFKMENGELAVRFAPVLKGSMFKEDHTASFTMCKNTKVIYNNPLHENTYGSDSVKVNKIKVTGEKVWEFTGDTVTGAAAEAIRSGENVTVMVDLA